MRSMYFLLSVSLFLIIPSSAAAEAETKQLERKLAELEEAVRKLTSTVEAQQEKIEQLESAKATSPKVVSSSSMSAAKVPYLPEIGVIADIVASSTESKEDEEGNDRLSVREVELVIGHDVDPYLRLDSTFVFSDFEEASVEEAYASFFSLPYDLKGKLGKFRQRIGKASTLHRDSLETVDEPLVVQRYLGVEGLSNAGVEFGAFTPFSVERFTQEVTVGVMEGGVGEDGELLADVRRHPSFYGHISNFAEIGELSSAELGGTYLLGSGDEDQSPEVHLFGVDGTILHRTSANQRLKLQTELFVQERPDGDDHDNDGWGLYALADYRFAQRWAAGARYDVVEPVLHEGEPRRSDRAVTAYLTFFQSEFARWRMQYQHARLADGLDDDRLFLQGTFAIGTHKHQIQ